MSTNPRSLGKYELHNLLGRGGMAEVWKAFDPRLKRYVAIKFLNANLRTDPTFATRFVREAQAVASLRHPNIIRIYDFESSISESENDSMTYMVMDYVEGQTLADYIRGTSHAHKFPSVAEIVHLFTPIGAAIGYAHQHGMIHRDIKPANILLDKHNTARNPMGEPILSDFGIVKMLGTDTGTLTSSSIGTPLYISPEQAQGQPGNEHSDIYSLGITLYEVCAGVPPFRGDNLFAILNQHINTPPPSPALINLDIPPGLEAVILRCLSKEPEERFPNAAALNAALTGVLEQSIASSDTINQQTYSTSLQGNTKQSATLSSPVHVESIDTPDISGETISSLSEETKVAQSEEMMPTLVTKPRINDPSTPLPLAVQPVEAASTSTPTSSPSALHTPPSLVAITPKRHPQRKGLYVALIALLVIVLSGSSLGAFLVFSSHSHPQTVVTGVVGHAFFSSSGRSSGSNSLGINDTFQIRLSNIPNPPSNKNYFAWLLPDNDQNESASIALGPLNIANGIASLPSAYIDPQNNNLIGSFSRVLITEEATNPPPQSYSLDKKMWRYYAELPQTPASKDCKSSITQLSDLCHIRHLLSSDPTLQRVGLPSGLSYWLLNNIEEVQKWAREAVDHNAGVDIRHKLINILYMLDGVHCIQQDVQQASPGTDNTPDDSTLQKIAAIPLLDCALRPSASGYLIHIHNHLSAIIQSPGVLADQVTLATQINAELNNVKVMLSQIRSDGRRLVAMNNIQLTQSNGLALRTEMDALAARMLSGGNNPTTGEPEPGIAHISDQIQQLATFDIKPYTTG